MNRRAGVLIALAALPNVAMSQRKSIITTGAIYRYLGDTLWSERDSTISRTIYRGDTVVRTTIVNDSIRRSMIYVAEGSMARVVAVTGRDGKPATLPAWGPVSVESLGSELRLLEIELRMQDTRARMSQYSTREEPTPTTDVLRSYAPAPDIRLVHFKDTVRYIRGCPNATRFDTTTFVMFGTDSAKRVKPQRTFGPAMALTLLGAMRSATNRESLNARGPAPPTDLPRPPKVCG